VEELPEDGTIAPASRSFLLVDRDIAQGDREVL
jgi:hypothetical protein